MEPLFKQPDSEIPHKYFENHKGKAGDRGRPHVEQQEGNRSGSRYEDRDDPRPQP
jgi:hypothetical protein